MWSVSGDDIKTWAERYDAASVLPDLVRRLILATSSPDSIEMRADGGVRLPDWDGQVTATEERPFCPIGTSRWELSVERCPKSKLDRDYTLRRSSADATHSYVAVTIELLRAVNPKWATPLDNSPDAE